MRKILFTSLLTLLLTACAAQEEKSTEIPVVSEPTFVLSDPLPEAELVVNKEKPTVKIASVEEEKESSVFVSLKKYMELHDLPSEYAAEYAGYVEKYADKYEVDPFLVLAVIHVETGSTYIHKTEPNRHGAVGLMQILERNLKCNNSPEGCYQDIWEGYTKEDLKVPEKNIELGVKYLKYLIDRFGYELGVTAYNQGEGNVSRGTYRTWYGDKVFAALECIVQGKENRY